MKSFPKLFAKGKKDEIRVWEVWADENQVFTEYGVKDGKLQTSSYKTEGKNIGKKNETSPETQAELEAESLWKKKIDSGYVEDPSLLTNEILLPMLALDFNAKHLEDTFYMQPKLDGFRCLAYWENSEIVLKSRKNKSLTGLLHIKEALKQILPKNLILDGELYIHNVNFQDLSSLIKNGDRSVQYWVYDCVTDKDFSERLLTLKSTIGSLKIDSVKIVDTLQFINPIDPISIIDTTHDQFVQDNFEGAMIRNSSGSYLKKHRSKDLLKYKKFQDAEFEILDVIEGKGKYEGKAIFICETHDKKRSFECSIADSMAARASIFENRELFIGEKLTIKFQGLSKDNIPRFPVGIKLRPEFDV